ncbi:MAG: rRNA maturation RNase YbeY [Bdellovibrionaceae bacterium]|nr:rRNA maturation RNase YbeY [Bdellovibrionales bacterium]MCB9085905.1 rRNA maturation RNase YbeY [Pseudobdellovibrionaceae bacterium]
MTVLVLNQGKSPVPRKFVESSLTSFARSLKRRKVGLGGESRELVVVFADERQARALNFQYRKKDYATDVLSFESLDSDSFGELVLCLDVVRRQAKEHGLTVREELSYLLLHGFLHLLGYDHEGNETEAQRMFDLQDSIWKSYWARRG